MSDNARKARVNLPLLRTTTFDSGAIGLLAMILRKFEMPGYYRVAVLEGGHEVADIDFKVDEESEVMQLDIDLALAVRQATAVDEVCGCKGDYRTSMEVSSEGYVLFHASSDGQYSVIVSNRDGAVFDSTNLEDGDMFAVSLLEPSTYSMKNTVDSAKGDMVVKLPSGKQIRNIDTRYVEVKAKRFDPTRVELVSSQGLVFKIQSAARIVIEKKDGSKGSEPKQETRWQKAQIRKDKEHPQNP